MTLEAQMDTLIDEIRKLRAAVEQGTSTVIPDSIPEDTIVADAPANTPDVTDLSAMPANPTPPPGPGVNGAEVVAPLQPPPPQQNMVTKDMLWNKMTEVYQALDALKRGAEVGQILQDHGAQHIDSIREEHYGVIYQKLDAKLKEIKQ